MATLSKADILKRNNIKILEQRINGGSVLIKDKNSDLYNCTGQIIIEDGKNKHNLKKPSVVNLKAFAESKTSKLFIEVKIQNKKQFVNLTSIYKDKEFGGTGSSGTAKEDAQLESLNNQIREAILKSGTDHIVIDINGKKHKVTKAETTPGTPKSDFHLLDINGKECVWISHKYGKTAKDFQQWGGVSKKEYPETPKDVVEFVNRIKSIYGNSLPTATTCAMHISDNKLKNQAVYGVNYGKTLGRQNVSILLQGEVKLVHKNKYYVLDSYNVHYNGDKITGDFEPVLMAIYKGDRSNFDIRGARFGILPIGSRNNIKWV